MVAGSVARPSSPITPALSVAARLSPEPGLGKCSLDSKATVTGAEDQSSLLIGSFLPLIASLRAKGLRTTKLLLVRDSELYSIYFLTKIPSLDKGAGSLP